MEEIGGYALQITTKAGFDECIALATQLLQDQGFGILTEIDVQATFKKKLNLDYKPYRILGACNPPFAHRSLSAVPQIGVLLPCNVVVWDEGDHRVVAAMEPAMMARIVDNPEIVAVTGEISRRLHEVLNAFERKTRS